MTAKSAVLKTTTNTKTYFGFGKNDYPYLIGLIIIIFIICYLRSNFLDVPFERDEGSYSYCGKIILNGAVPFKDIGSQRLPGVFYCYALIVAIFGYTLESLHTAFIFINIISTIFVFLVARKMLSNIAGISAAMCWALMSLNKGISGFTIQSEHLVGMFALIGIYFLLKFFDKKSLLMIGFSGLFFSFAFEVKQTSVFLGFFAGIILATKQYFEKDRSWKTIILSCLVFCTAVLIPLIIDLYIVWARGGWEDFQYWFFDIRNEYSSVISFEQGMKYLKMTWTNIYTDYKFFWIISFLGPIILLFTNVKPWLKILVIGFHGFGFLTVMPGNHYYGHYFLQWIPTVCIGAGSFFYSIEEIIRTNLKLQNFSRYIVLGVLVIATLSNISALRDYYFYTDSTQLLRQVYGINPFPESKVIADKLNSMLKPEDKIAVFGTEIQMYFYTNRISPSRFAGSGALLEFPTKKAEEWQKEFIGDVEKANPRFLIFYSHPISWLANPKVKNLIFPWFNDFTTSKYNLIGYADMYDNITNYAWAPNLDMVNNPPKSQYKIFVFEKK
jgi:4-amino-4-deoxy-L-arabinose transferase-like glycosyltransferase